MFSFIFRCILVGLHLKKKCNSCTSNDKYYIGTQDNDIGHLVIFLKLQTIHYFDLGLAQWIRYRFHSHTNVFISAPFLFFEQPFQRIRLGEVVITSSQVVRLQPPKALRCRFFCGEYGRSTYTSSGKSSAQLSQNGSDATDRRLQANMQTGFSRVKSVQQNRQNQMLGFCESAAHSQRFYFSGTLYTHKK